MTDLRRHVPRIALEWDDDAPGEAWQQVDASLVFADISGFTALTERLARRGRIGAEELIETLNRVFGGMLGMAGARGGELLKFGGDALLFTFRGDDHAYRACAAAVDMRIALRDAASVPTSVGRLRLKMSVGIHSGPVDFFLVGAPTRELLILGPGATATADAEKLADAGQIVVTPETAARLPRGSTRPREDGALLLRWRSVPPPGTEPPPMPDVTEDRLRSLFPYELGNYLADRVPDPEHKIATIGFARFSGTDALLAGPGPQAVAEALQGTAEVFMSAMNDEGVTLLATDLDSDGGKFFMGSGVPQSTEDDEGSMLRAMRRVLDVGTPLPVQIGVNRGHVFAAEVGALDRAAYSAMGDTTNTAARIMGKAPHGVLFAHPTVLERSRTLFATEPAGPFPMKGKAVPVLVHSVGEETGTRGPASESRLPLVGRDEEVDRIRVACAAALSGRGGVVVVSGGTGSGKSRVVAEALSGYSDVRTILVRAEPYGASAPYRVLRDPVRALLGVERGTQEEMADAVRAGVRRLAPELITMAPLLGDVVSVSIPETPEVRAIEPRFRPDRIAELILRLVEKTFQGPLMMRVEEGHWADAASSQVLARFAAESRGRPWAMIVTRRDDGGFLPDGDLVELGPLPDDVIRRLVIEATRATPMRPHEIDEVVRRAGGNALFVEEITRAFQELGSLDSVPDNLHAALDAQIDALDPHSRRVLRYASVLGRSFRTEVLNETLRGDDLVVDASTIARLDGFLERDGEGRLRFRNGMIRDAAYEGLAYRLRTKLHAAAGRAVEKLSEDLEADADTLSLHYWRGGDDAKTWVYSRMAGDRAARAYANVDAAVLYERALEAAKRIDVPDQDRLTIFKGLAQVKENAALFDGAIEALTQAVRLSAADRYASADLLRQRAQVRQRAGSFTAAMAEVTKAEKLLAGDDSLEARRLRVRLKSVRAGIRGAQERLMEARAVAEAYADEAREVGELESLAQALALMDVTDNQRGDMTVGERTLESVELMRGAGNLRRVYIGYMNLGVFRFFSGHWDESQNYYRLSQEAALAVGDSVGAAVVATNLAEVLVYLGRLDEAEDVVTDAVRVLHVSGVQGYAAYGRLQLARAVLARGDLDGAASLAEEAEQELVALDQRESAAEAALVRAESLSRQGRPEEALALVESVSQVVAETVTLQPRQRLERARAALAQGRADDALADAREGLELAREHALPYEETCLLRLMSEIQAALGDPAAAEAAVGDADAILRRLGAAV